MRGVGWEGCWGGGVEEGGTNRCARLHAVAARPHCRLTLNVPGDAARHGEWISCYFPPSAGARLGSVALDFSSADR